MERSVHMAEMDEYHEIFYQTWLRAHEEMLRLRALCKEVEWYSFEVTCRKWVLPWHQTLQGSNVHLFGARYETSTRRGRVREKGSFPVYYSGPVERAPMLPPTIILQEYYDARAYERKCSEMVAAPYEWAPGGDLYQEHARTCLAARTLSDQRGTAHDHGSSRAGASCCGRIGLKLGDPMERSTQKAVQSAPTDLLARIRANGRVVCPRARE